ncbi:SAGA-associated factor 11 homolog [Tribolium castaneum]|uniref:SAGA-associated factor 11 n=1 Tax=Tribolium castaneum TaxID=7070 RepID=D6WTZ6_TRICA|nr:PREDICTED: SAGA-associated factor 11 homolog [Tribolium castaneum]EFA07309.1 SAGA-associated factor 11 homolog-like Protein [Tribolium castaneum]|eukprot:XP_008200159.1 PREDICTED: SAGA-associated factor 11 homolog [Tribolium castaneum]
MSKSQKLDDKQLLSKLAKDFHELVSNKEILRTSVESFLNNVIDELTLGIIFDLHRKYKTNAYEVDMEEEEGDEEDAEADVFTQQDVKKTQDCVCPNCDRAVAATRFAPHLETCMGMGRNRFRNATRRVASSTKERENSSFSGVPSDDEDDMDWNSGNKRGKKKKRNGSKKSKSGGTPKKSCEARPSDSVEVEAEDDDLSSLRDLLQDHSNSSSPADSVSSSHSNSSKKKDKAKSKKSKRDRASPSSSISAD